MLENDEGCSLINQVDCRRCQEEDSFVFAVTVIIVVVIVSFSSIIVIVVAFTIVVVIVVAFTITVVIVVAFAIVVVVVVIVVGCPVFPPPLPFIF